MGSDKKTANTRRRLTAGRVSLAKRAPSSSPGNLPANPLASFASLGELLDKIAPRKKDWIRQQVENRVAVGVDDSPEGHYQLLKTVIVACYEEQLSAAIVAHQLAAEVPLGKEFEDLSLSSAQLDSLRQPQHPVQEAIRHLTYSCDLDHAHFIRDSFAMDFLFRNLRVVMEVFERRMVQADVNLDKEFGFSVPGRGRRSQLSKKQSDHSWSENCFEIHMLVLSGQSVAHACSVFADDSRSGKKSSSGESLTKMYRAWCKDPITSIRLQRGDALAKSILSQQAPRDILAKHFPPRSV